MTARSRQEEMARDGAVHVTMQELQGELGDKGKARMATSKMNGLVFVEDACLFFNLLKDDNRRSSFDTSQYHMSPLSNAVILLDPIF